jgi:hypothetical protein
METEEGIGTPHDDFGFDIWGMFHRAVDLIDALPSGIIRDTQFYTLRLIVCTATNNWTAGLDLCRLAGHADTSDVQLQRSLRQFHLAFAKNLRLEGKPAGAGRSWRG